MRIEFSGQETNAAVAVTPSGGEGTESATTGSVVSPAEVTDWVNEAGTQLLDLTVAYAPRFALALVVLVVGWIVIGILRRGIQRLLGMKKIDITVGHFLGSLASIAMKVMLLLSVAGMLGVEVTSFIAILSAATLAIGLALKGTLSNFAGGISVLLFRPFKVGDFITGAGQSGSVKAIHIFNTILTTGDNQTVIIPNNAISTGVLVNSSTQTTRRIQIDVGIGYEDDIDQARKLLSGLDCLVVQDNFMTRTAELADVVFPASVAWAESDGTVTSSERRVQRTRPAVTPPGQARHDIDIMHELAKRMGVDLGATEPEALWDELRSLSPMHGGMSYERLESEGGLQWPCPDLDHPGSPFLHGWLWEEDLGGRAPSPFSVVEHEGPNEKLTDQFPLRLTTGRSLDSYNTGVQSNGFQSPIRYGEELDINPADGVSLNIVDGERVSVSSPRGTVEMNVRFQPDIPVGLTFTTYHFPALVDINKLTNDAWDKRSGTSEFKAASIRVDKISA